MKSSAAFRAFLVAALLCPACGQSGEETARTVQAATKAAAEVGQQLAAKAAELAHMAPEQAKLELQGLVDASVKAFDEVKDSEAAQKLIAEVKRVLEELRALAAKLGEKLDLAALSGKVSELATRFEQDPHVANAVQALHDEIEKLTH